MSDTSVVTAVHLPATSKEARDKIYSYLHEIVENTRVNEPGTVKYAICVPDGELADTTIYVFEEYADPAAWNTHMSAQPVKEFLTLLNEEKGLLGPDMYIKHLSWIPGASLSRTSRLPTGTSHDLRDRVKNPYVLWATITDPEPADIEALAPYGEKIVKYAQENEPDTLFYADARLQEMTPMGKSDDPQGGFIAALEVYASKEACLKHLQDDSVKALSEQSAKLHSTLTPVLLNMVEGWLTRA